MPEVCRAVLEAVSEQGGQGGGEIALQLREKDLPARELYGLAEWLGELCRRFGAPFLVNDRLDVALAAGADGVHLPADSLRVEDARRLLGPHRLIGVSTHNAAEIAEAAAAGADFAVFGPVYEPLSKRGGYGPARGAAALFEATEAARLPVFALGGITAERVRELGRLAAAAGRRLPAGAAVIGAVFAAPSPGQAVRELIAALRKSGFGERR